MKLIDIAQTLDTLHEGQFICAKRPWTEQADCELVPIDDTFKVPANVTERGFEYFLEVAVAREICEVFGQIPASSQEIAKLLLFYAENDAFPQWVYER